MPRTLWPLARPLLCALLLGSVAWLGALCLTVKECELDFFRLPKRARPTHYKLDLRVDPREPSFAGRVDIELWHEQNSDSSDALCRKSASDWDDWFLAACNRARLILSADKSLEIAEVAYWNSGRWAIPIVEVCRASERDMLVIELSRKPQEGTAGALRLSFTGRVQRKVQGLFRSEYQSADSAADKLMALTQFQSGHARKVFPCFDEPDFKATFELSVEHPSHLAAIANTRPLRSEQTRQPEDDAADGAGGGEFTRTYFARTPRMSSYLLAFAVGEFDRLEASGLQSTHDPSGMTIGIYTPPGRAHEARSSLDVAVRAYAALREFFDAGQPLDKIDFVSCKNFPGAMENWGLIAIEEFSVLRKSDADYGVAGDDDDDGEAVSAHYSLVCLIHELAHHWFGNLVTLKWWDDLWLNEGFASWISNELADALYPELGAKFIYLLRDVRQAFALDAQRNKTHPIKNSQLQSLAEIERSFDEIAYQKSDAVIRMLCDYVGLEKFKAGLRRYIAANQFGNADESDLWRALGDASGLDVRQLMHSWITQAGFPLISVNYGTHENGNAPRLLVSQARFPESSTAAAAADALAAPFTKRQTWLVPITLVVSNGVDKLQRIKFVLREASDEVKLPSWFALGAPGHWLKLNADFQGYYRVQYESAALLDALRASVETKSMGPADRLNFLEDALGLSRAGLMSESRLVDLLSWFGAEDHDGVVDLICKALERLDLERLEPDKRDLLYSILIRYYEQSGRLAPEVPRAGQRASLLRKMARADTLERLVAADYAPAIRDALELFERTNGSVPLFVRDQVLAAVGRAGSDEQFRRVIKLLHAIDTERVRNTTVNKLRAALRGNERRTIKLDAQFF